MDAMLNQLGYNDTGIGLHITSSGGGSGGQEKPMGKAKNKYEKVSKTIVVRFGLILIFANTRGNLF